MGILLVEDIVDLAEGDHRLPRADRTCRRLGAGPRNGRWSDYLRRRGL